MSRAVVLGLALLVYVGQAACADTAPFLWEVEGSEGAKVYLFGSYHFAFSAREHLAPIVWTRLEQADGFVAEADTRDGGALTDWEQARLPAGQTLNQLLSPAAWQQLLRALDTVPPARLGAVRPWVINALILATLQPTDEAMDVTLLREAGRLGKPLDFLETTPEQLAMLNRIPLTEAIPELEQSMSDYAQVRRDLDSLADAYRRGDAEGFLAFDGYDHASETFDIVIRQRNSAWLPQVESLLEETTRTTFVVVGLSHLIGADGLVASLTDAGYSVQRIED